MSRSSGKGSFRSGDRAAVEPIAALIAVVVVGAALGLYTVALDEATAERDRPTAEATLDRVESTVTAGGIVEPDQLNDIEQFRFATLAELEADGERWRVDSGVDAPKRGDMIQDATARDASDTDTFRKSEAVDVAERAVTVRLGPGENVRGTLRVVVRR